LLSHCPEIVGLTNPYLKPPQMDQEPCGWAEHDLNWDGRNLKKDDFVTRNGDLTIWIKYAIN
jgi:hypothetical protein